MTVTLHPRRRCDDRRTVGPSCACPVYPRTLARCHNVDVVSHSDEDLSRSQFADLTLDNARFHRVYLTNANFDMVDFTGSTFRDVDLINVTVSGSVENLRINDVDVGPLIESELDRRYPGRALMRAENAEEFREAWRILESLWRETTEKAILLPSSLLNERVHGEWSFLETLRHLVFATDSWVRRVIEGEPMPWDRLGMPFDGMADDPAVPFDREARPTLDEVLELRVGRMESVRSLLATLTNSRLDELTTPVEGPGWPPPDQYSVRQCLRIILNEEWEHRRYAERDLAALNSPD